MPADVYLACGGTWARRNKTSRVLVQSELRRAKRAMLEVAGGSRTRCRMLVLSGTLCFIAPRLCSLHLRIPSKACKASGGDWETQSLLWLLHPSVS